MSDGIFGGRKVRSGLPVGLGPAVAPAAHIVDFPSRNIQEHDPVFNTSSYAVDGDVLGCAPVSGLGGLRSPSAVSGFIVPVIVFSLDSVPWRGLRPHILIESNEVIQPSVGYGNASAAVIHVFWAVFVIASSLHASPNFVFIVLTKAMKVFSLKGVCSEGSCAVLRAKTPATADGLAKVGAGRPSKVSAVALAHPHGVPLMSKSFGWSEHSQAPEAKPGKVFKNSHSMILCIVSVSGTRTAI